MSKQMKKTIFGILGGIVLMLLIAYLPPETEMMSRQGWQYLGCFGFLLTCLISGALPDWVATLATMVMLLVFKLGKVADVTVEFSGTTVWLCIGVFIMSVGINNSGFMKRLALWVLTKFPGTYRGQVTAMMLAGIITTPMIPSSYAKTSIMAPLIGQVCEAVGAEPNSKAARGLVCQLHGHVHPRHCLHVRLGVRCADDWLHAGPRLHLGLLAQVHDRLVSRAHRSDLSVLHDHLQTERKARRRRDLPQGAVQGARRRLQEGEAGHHHRCHRHHPLDHPEAARRGRRLRGHRG